MQCKLRFRRFTERFDICVSQITMTTRLLLLLLILHSQSVDSQSTTGDDVCAAKHSNDMMENMSEMKQMLANQQQLLQTIVNRLGKSQQQEAISFRRGTARRAVLTAALLYEKSQSRKACKVAIGK